MNIDELVSLLFTPRTNKKRNVITGTDTQVLRDFIPFDSYRKDSTPIGLTNILLQKDLKSETFPVVDGFPVFMASRPPSVRIVAASH